MDRDKLIELTDKAISELVYDKLDLQKAYNYYDGILDEDLYKFLEEEYGIGNPTSMIFVPLIKKHVDALVGEVLETPILPQVSCKDSATLSKITREKELLITQEVLLFLNKRLLNKIIAYIQGNGSKLVDSGVQKEVDDLKEDIDTSFISNYEIAAQHVVEYILQSRNIDIRGKLRDLALDTLITGELYYQAHPSQANNNIVIDVLDPRNTFVEMNPESNYAKDGDRAVIRRWMSKLDIISKYGDKLSKDDISNLDDVWSYLHEIHYTNITAIGTGLKIPLSSRHNRARHNMAGYPVTNEGNEYNSLVPVYEVEWILTDKKTYILYRYKSIRIGESIYILLGKDDTLIRTLSDPKKAYLSVNGVQYIRRSGIPYSMVLACAPLQDRYNALIFYRDNLIASSGTVGDIIDISVLPKILGNNLAERLKKWATYKKQGIALIDTSQEGRLSEGMASPNTIYNGYDDTVKVLAIQAIELAILSIENTCSSITGVFRERLNGILQKDAVANVQVSQTNSFTITKQFSQQIDTVIEELLLDALNVGKIVYKNGLIGTINLGDKLNRVFTALPEYFTLTDYDIHIVTNSDITKLLELLKALVPEFVKGGIVPPDLIIEGITCRSLTEYKLKLARAIKKLHDENSLLNLLQLQLLQMLQELKLAQSELSKAQNKIQQLNEAKIKLDQEELKYKSLLEWYKARTDRSYKQALKEELEKRTKLEMALLYDRNPYNDKIRLVDGI